MGDRAEIYFKDSRGVGPGTYLHWGGADVAVLLFDTWKLMEGSRTDRDYVTARFVGVCNQAFPGNLSLGCMAPPTVLSADLSPGDAGIFVVDVSTPLWSVETFGGYGLSDADDRGAQKLYSWVEVLRAGGKQAVLQAARLSRYAREHGKAEYRAHAEKLTARSKRLLEAADQVEKDDEKARPKQTTA